MIEIIEYKDINKKFCDKEINDFINENIYIAIGKPFKQRSDLINIEEYYIKNGGNFWIAIDIKENKIIGSIALEKREDKGILKRFYVHKDYQRFGIGTKLYMRLEEYVIQMSNIKLIYLVSGKLLKNAHNFYINKGFEMIDKLELNLELEMEIDNYIFFKKNINNKNC